MPRHGTDSTKNNSYFHASFLKDGIKIAVDKTELTTLTCIGKKQFITRGGEKVEVISSRDLYNRKYVDAWGNDIAPQLYMHIIHENKGDAFIDSDNNKKFKYLELENIKTPVFSNESYNKNKKTRKFNAHGQDIKREMSPDTPFYIEYYWTGKPLSWLGRITYICYYKCDEVYHQVFTKTEYNNLNKLSPTSYRNIIQKEPAIKTQGHLYAVIDNLLADINNTYANRTSTSQISNFVGITTSSSPDTDNLNEYQQTLRRQNKRKRESSDNKQPKTMPQYPVSQSITPPTKQLPTEMEQQAQITVNQPYTFFHRPMHQQGWSHITQMPSEEFNERCDKFNFMPTINPFNS